MRVSLVLWDGNVGGAEKLTAELAGGLRGAGVETTVVFVRDPKHLGPELDRLAVPYVSLGARRVEEVLVHPRRFARLVAAHGPDGVLLPATGHQAPALRLGGYRAPIVAMEHGFLLLIDRMSPRWRTARRLERRLSAPFVDVEVAVSRFMAERVREAPHARRVEVIQNGIDAGRFAASEPTGEGGCTFAFASRLVEGKGLEELVAAFARLAAEDPGVRLKIAGDGPGRPELETALERHDVGGRVELAGVVTDMPSYWRDADVAVMPSTASESFGMVALEAMACGRPVVATRNGGADDLVDDGVTGRLVACGDVYALEAAMRGYARDPRLRRAHGRAGRERCEAQFTIDRCATRYARLLREAARERQSSASSRRTSTPRDLKRVSGHAE